MSQNLLQHHRDAAWSILNEQELFKTHLPFIFLFEITFWALTVPEAYFLLEQMRESIQNASICSPYVLQKKSLVICQVQCWVLIIKPAEWLHQWFLPALMKGTACLPGFQEFLFPTLVEIHVFPVLKEPRPQMPSFSDMVFKLMTFYFNDKCDSAAVRF